MTDNDVYIIILEDLKRISDNKEYIEGLQSIINGLKGKDHVEEQDSPQFKSVEMWGRNIFPFTIEQYRKMAEWIIKNRENKNE